MSHIEIRAIKALRVIREETKKQFPAHQLRDPAFRNAIKGFILDRLMLIEDSELRIYALEEARNGL